MTNPIEKRFLKFASLPLALAIMLSACMSAPSSPTPSSSESSSPSSAASDAPAVGESPQGLGSPPLASAMPSSGEDQEGMQSSGVSVTEVDEAAPEERTIEISSFAFDPPRLEISVGETVTWRNLDAAPHTVTAGSDADEQSSLFDSGLLEQGDTFTLRFDQPGEYQYFCTRHPPMQGLIVVLP